MLSLSDSNDADLPIQQSNLYEDQDKRTNTFTMHDPLNKKLDSNMKKIDPDMKKIDSYIKKADPDKKLDHSANMDDFLKNIWISDDHHALISVESPVHKHELMGRMPNSAQTEGEEEEDDYDDDDDDNGDRSWKNTMLPTGLIDSNVNIRHERVQPHVEPMVVRQTAKTEDEGEVTLEDFMRRAGICREVDGISASNVVSSSLLSDANVTGLDIFNPHIGGTDHGNTVAFSASIVDPIAHHVNTAISTSVVDSIAPHIQSDWLKFASRGQSDQRIMQQSVVKDELIPSSNLLGGANMHENLAIDHNTGFCAHNNLSQGLISLPHPSLGVSSSVVSEFNYSMRGRKRLANESVIEKTVERRQRRMIKNRESAARSRARKQVNLMSNVILKHIFYSISA